MGEIPMSVCTNKWVAVDCGALPDDTPVVMILFDEGHGVFVALMLSSVLSAGVLAVIRCLSGGRKRKSRMNVKKLSNEKER